ncbi:hypothetical protein [Hymenobacter convexus]|uniref:hypothetical protein n=1 Tax=Hymenobacter sp. CA1UV-4 TaxID=3063782 RepID=UPI002712D7B6|nr:hypothetical protein [Hymenobacter sp. CA1UV-4]MDO7851359.1 hypothetical protein [Hymenobacter sp. CA1UV-4]
MTAPESAFELLVATFEAAAAEDTRLRELHPPEPGYQPEDGYITPNSVAAFKDQLAAYEPQRQAKAQAEQALHAAKAALDAWFPAPVAAALAEGVAVVAPAAEGTIALVRHNDAYLIERAATREEALNKIERFLNQF